MAKDRLATIFLGVEADVKQAMKDLDKLLADSAKMAEKANKKIEDSQKKIAEHQKKALEGSEAGEKRRMGWIDGYNKKIKEQVDLLKKLNKIDNQADKRIQNEKKVLEALENQKQLQKAKMKDYNDFLKSSAKEHSRYADELSRRDRTASLTENLQRGYQKGQIISEKFHPQENKMQRASRSLNIAASAFTPTKGFAERQTDIFYNLQKTAYMLQTAFGTLAGTIGDLVGGLMSLVAVAGQAVTGLVAIGGAMASMMAGMMAAKIALSGVGAAVQQLWSGQNQYNKALRDAKKAFRDLRFEAEQAALSEQEAAIALEKAREDFARMQDLPPDSRMYREGKLALDQAELNYRMAKAKTKDLQNQLKRGPVMPKDPFANLTKSQKVFAKYLLTLKPVVQELKESAASGFLPPLQKAIQSIVETSLPTFNKALHVLGEGMGNASMSFAKAFTNKNNLEMISKFATSSKKNIESFGRSAGNAFTGILNLLVAAKPLTDKFVTWTEKVTKNFAEMTAIGKNSGGIAQFLDPKAIETAGSGIDKHVVRTRNFWKELGAAGGSILDSLKNMIEAAFPKSGKGGGWVMLDFITKITTSFNKFTNSAAFGPWLTDATKNIVAAVTTIGKFLGIMVKMAGSPDTKKFWETLQKAVPYVQKMLEDGAKAGPAFADVIVKVTEFISLLSDSAALISFYNTLGFIFSILNSILTVIKPILDKMGAWHGVILAVVVILGLMRKAAVIFMGIMAKMSRTVGTVSGAMINFGEKVTIARRAINKPLLPGLNKLSTVEIPKAATAMTRFKIATTNGMKIAAGSVWGVGKALLQMNAQMKNAKRTDYMLTMARNSDRVTTAIMESQRALGNMGRQGKIVKQQMAALKAEMDAIAISAANAGKAVSYKQLTSGPLAQQYGLGKLGGRANVGGRFMRYGGAAMAGAVGVGSAIDQASQGGAGNVIGGIGSGLMAAGAIAGMTGVGMPIALGLEAAGMIATAIGGMVTAEEDKKKQIQIAEADIRVLQQTNTENATVALMQAGNVTLSRAGELITKMHGYTAAATTAAATKTGVTLDQSDTQGILDRVMVNSPEIAAALAANPALASKISQAGAQIAGSQGLKFGTADEKESSYTSAAEQIIAEYSRNVTAGVTDPLKAAAKGIIASSTGRIIKENEYGNNAQTVLNTPASAVAFNRLANTKNLGMTVEGYGLGGDNQRALSLNDWKTKWENEDDATMKNKIGKVLKTYLTSTITKSYDPTQSQTNAVVPTSIKVPSNLGAPGFNAYTQVSDWQSQGILGSDDRRVVPQMIKPDATTTAEYKTMGKPLLDAATGMTGLTNLISNWKTTNGTLHVRVEDNPDDNKAPVIIIPPDFRADPSKASQVTFLDSINREIAKAWRTGG